MDFAKRVFVNILIGGEKYKDGWQFFRARVNLAHGFFSSRYCLELFTIRTSHQPVQANVRIEEQRFVSDAISRHARFPHKTVAVCHNGIFKQDSFSRSRTSRQSQ